METMSQEQVGSDGGAEGAEGADQAVDRPAPRAGVQSVERAFRLLELMADSGGMIGISQLAAESGLPLPTIHRLIRTLVDIGYVRQEPSRQYVLGPRLMRLGESSERSLTIVARPHLARLVEDLGESANLAMLDGNEVVYVAQVPSRHSMRMFTEVGRRVMPHCTAVGKAMLAKLPSNEVLSLLQRTGMPRQTANTITDSEAFLAELEAVRVRGYAVDDGEQEVGVRCVAVRVEGISQRLAVSISGPYERMSDVVVAEAFAPLQDACRRLAIDLV